MSDNFPKISIVTATYNQGNYIEESILSILDQKYPNLEYIIIDGGSTDNTIDIIKKYSPFLAYWTSESDNGLYDALNTGFQKATGQILGWLNSDDLLMRKSLFVLADIFSNNLDVDWVQGHPCVADENGRIVYQRPQRSSKYSFYRKEYHDGKFIQQESTYWRRSLWEKSGKSISQKYKYAGDFELWMRFYKYADLYITPALIGAFRIRAGQFSAENYKAYIQECDDIIEFYVSQLPHYERLKLQRTIKSSKAGKLEKVIRRISLNTESGNSDSKDYSVVYNHVLKKFIKNS